MPSTQRLGSGKLVAVTFSQLRALEAVARTGNVTRAAEDLGITQPAISHSLQALERELGATLLVRRSSGVMLTALGREVSARASLILRELQGIRQHAAVARGMGEGKLRLGVIPSVNARLLPNVLRSFAVAQPNIKLAVLEGSDGEVLEWLRTGAIDVATVADAAEDLDTTALARDELLAILPSDHPLAQEDTVSIADLAGEPFIMSSGGCEPLIRAIATGSHVNLRSHYHVGDTNSIVSMVAEHLGVSVMPELAIPGRRPQITAVPLRPREFRELSLAVLRDCSALPAAVTFIEHASSMHPDHLRPPGDLVVRARVA